MDGFKTYTCKSLKGSLGDFETEWWTEEDWERHRKYVEELKASGEYLQPQETTIIVSPSSMFDGIGLKRVGIGQYRFALLDLSK